MNDLTPSRWRGLYPITPDEIDTARLLERTALALAALPGLLQYRNKLADAALRREQAKRLLPLCRAVGVPLIVNDDLALALDLAVDGVHLGRGDGDAATARRALDAAGPGRILGVSCYDEWPRAVASAAAGADYVAFGAMFASPTKPSAARAPFSLLGRARRELNVTVAAIGGITLENVGKVFAAGADLVAVISDVFDADDPGARAEAYKMLSCGRQDRGALRATN
ncbi:MAG: thiamine phosphate synthase [Azoarcus sp.]|jgi:thiamine-phosphate pyrophosphorylase|nr:thiamine phosphate synthase [Azoarcus sp.]